MQLERVGEWLRRVPPLAVDAGLAGVVAVATGFAIAEQEAVAVAEARVHRPTVDAVLFSRSFLSFRSIAAIVVLISIWE